MQSQSIKAFCHQLLFRDSNIGMGMICQRLECRTHFKTAIPESSNSSMNVSPVFLIECDQDLAMIRLSLHCRANFFKLLLVFSPVSSSKVLGFLCLSMTSVLDERRKYDASQS